MLTNTDLTEDPGETWVHIEKEMEKLLDTVGSLNQPNRVADVERRLLGLVLKEENVEKIEKIRHECKTGGKGKLDQGQMKLSRVEERVAGEDECTMDDDDDDDDDEVVVEKIEERVKCAKEIQVDTMDKESIVVTQVMYYITSCED